MLALLALATRRRGEIDRARLAALVALGWLAAALAAVAAWRLAWAHRIDVLRDHDPVGARARCWRSCSWSRRAPRWPAWRRWRRCAGARRAASRSPRSRSWRGWWSAAWRCSATPTGSRRCAPARRSSPPRSRSS
ncbi:MAG: hypothetical protein H6709_22935 [Kofleriaceae bacterium]|nr:hypothetical protein [Kofleriaceae bacterium]